MTIHSKYIESRFPRYHIFGESNDGLTVDIATPEDINFVTGLDTKEAVKLIDDRDILVDALIAVAQAFEESAPDDFDNIWYSTICGAKQVHNLLP